MFDNFLNVCNRLIAMNTNLAELSFICLNCATGVFQGQSSKNWKKNKFVTITLVKIDEKFLASCLDNPTGSIFQGGNIYLITSKFRRSTDSTAATWKEVSHFCYQVVVRWQQGNNGEEARDETEGKSGRVHREGKRSKGNHRRRAQRR